MNRVLNKITKMCYNADTDYFYFKIGNYSIKRDKNYIQHFYYGNCICAVNIISKKFKVSTCGYDNYRLTTAQINFLKEFYIEKGYKLL